jgi:hypothetical protein
MDSDPWSPKFDLGGKSSGPTRSGSGSTTLQLFRLETNVSIENKLFLQFQVRSYFIPQMYIDGRNFNQNT